MFANLLRYARATDGLEATVVYTNPTAVRAYNFLHVAAHAVAHMGRSDFAMLNVSRGGVLILGTLVRALHSLFGTPYSVRIYGGNFDLYYTNASGIARFLMRAVLGKAAFALVETRQLVAFLESMPCGARPVVRWLPNTRPITPERNGSHTARNVFFAGHINRDKGVETLLAAARQVHSDVHFHFFGAVREADLLASIRAAGNCTYHGELLHAELLERIREMDALVFPTHYAGEGYPGIIVETILMGKPVISTRWRAIPEIVADNGILVEVNDPGALAAAIDRLHDDETLYRAMSEAAYRIAGQFSSDARMKTLFAEILPRAMAGTLAPERTSSPASAAGFDWADADRPDGAVAAEEK